MIRIFAALVLCSLPVAEARTWTSVIDRSIYLQPQLDTSRYQLKTELDPFYKADEEIEFSPTASPYWSPAPTSMPSASPTNVPSSSPTAPTAAPTTRVDYVEGNGGCAEGTVLYRVNMLDSWGDGWSDTTLVIRGFEDEDSTEVSGSTVTTTHTSSDGSSTVTISSVIEFTDAHPFGTSTSVSSSSSSSLTPLGVVFEGTLNEGTEGEGYVCLKPSRCYDVYAYGGSYIDEVGWEIETVTLGDINATGTVIVEGGAPSQCSFSIPDENGELFCQTSCSSTLSPEYTEAPAVLDSLETEAPTEDAVITLQTRGYSKRAGRRNGNGFFSTYRNGQS
eukprot:Nitzschia sp. Nitz4//scaffold264_size26629//4378//5379//NITZ4_008231-RA/size26629-processed-gene-0.50-mRNA-1//1//CDS//3329544788//9346//frame0